MPAPNSTGSIATIEDQRTFRPMRAQGARLARNGRGGFASDNEADEEDGSDEEQNGAEENQDGDGEDGREDDTTQADKADASSEAMEETSAEAADAPTGEFDEEAEFSDAEQAADARRPPSSVAKPETPRPRLQDPSAARTTRRSRPRISARPEELERLRTYLDKQLQNLSSVVSRLANRLQRRLMAQQNRSWEFGPRRRPARSGAPAAHHHGPAAAAVLQAREGHRFPRHGRDACFSTIRARCAGGRSRFAATCADILARTLERCGVAVEILGFTTRAWKGGLAREGLAAGWKTGAARPPQRPAPHHLQIRRRALAPGAKKPRADDARGPVEGKHRRRSAGMGAQAPACARSEQRKILMMISDGAPVDDSTLSVNPGNYLERHLRHMIEEIETRSPVELIAIGIGHDVTRYYRRALTIVDAEELGGAMTEKLAELFSETAVAPTRAKAASSAPRGTIRRAARPVSVGVR